MVSLSFFLPRQADVADPVGEVAVAGEALLDSPRRPLTAARGPGGQRAPAG